MIFNYRYCSVPVHIFSDYWQMREDDGANAHTHAHGFSFSSSLLFRNIFISKPVLLRNIYHHLKKNMLIHYFFYICLLSSFFIVDSYDTTGLQQASFSYTGSSQNFALPQGVSKFYAEICGAEACKAACPSANSVKGFGGYIEAEVDVSAGANLLVYVGGQGGLGGGGFNGGGSGTTAGGGGASDIRTTTSLSSRILVAGLFVSF